MVLNFDAFHSGKASYADVVRTITHADLYKITDEFFHVPHLDITIARIPRFGPMNAIGIHMLGIFHGESQIQQLREIMRQSKTLV